MPICRPTSTYRSLAPAMNRPRMKIPSMLRPMINRRWRWICRKSRGKTRNRLKAPGSSWPGEDPAIYFQMREDHRVKPGDDAPKESMRRQLALPRHLVYLPVAMSPDDKIEEKLEPEPAWGPHGTAAATFAAGL